MRSMLYIIFGNPCNVDDCLDLSNTLITKSVNLWLDTEEIICEMYIAKRLKGIFIWEFNINKVRIEQDFGCIFFHESEIKQKEWINRSNKRLQRTINKIESHHITIIGKEQKFDYSLLFKRS